MANNRLFIANLENQTHCCIAKSMGANWNLGNIDLLKTLLDNSSEYDELIIGTEDDDDFRRKIRGSKNINKGNGWKYVGE